ncbi:MAG: hypothetical protein B6U69_01545 [Thermofilum sp. ex4484_15]|nr:MAG: hypothetical protein B6U69_01545 [Thermofilum sp. ex4484_15]
MVKIKIEDVLPSGERISITLEGREVNKRRIMQILDLLKIMGSPPSFKEEKLGETIWRIIVENYGDGSWFTSRELLLSLERELGINVKLNTVATYLLRFYRRGLLERDKVSGYGIKYRLKAFSTTLT